MAEVVERNLEGTLGEILHIRKAKLFNKSEINEIIRKRRQHEYALQKRNKRVLDYDAYITTELNILKLLRFRRQKNDDRRYIDKIERSIISRLVRLHRQLCYRFQSRIDVWVRFINFCKILGRHVSTVRLWNRLLQVHGRTDPRLWAAAASYHLHQNATAKIRTTMRKLTTETNEIADKRRKVFSELKSLTRHLDQKKQKKIMTVLTDLRETKSELEDSMKQLARDRRLVYDRITLHSIREARRLLSEGLTLNPQCKLLLIELAKLEACAADFFLTHITPRLDSQPAQSESNESKQRTDIASEVGDVKASRKRQKRIAKSVVEENARFMVDVTEDVPFVASGQAFRLVANSILDQWAEDNWAVENLQQVVTALPVLADDSLRSRLCETLERLKSQPGQSEVTEKEISASSKTELQSLLDDRVVKLYSAIQTDGMDAALELWNSWFTSVSEGDSVRADQFRYLNPELPEAVALLRLRLALCSLDLSWSNAERTAEGLVRTKEVVQQIRTWLDALSTSPWGQKSAEFWICYLQFERDSGDYTRIPAVQWRAKKTLLTQAYEKFTKLLNLSH